MEALLTPLDNVRSAALRLLGPWGQRFLVRREERVLLYALFGLAVAFAMTCASPVVLYAVGPIVLGTVHLVSDVRYLVARPALHRRVALAVLGGAPLLATFVWPTPSVGLLAGFAPILLARSSVLKKAALFVAYAALYALALRYTRDAMLFLVHAHNLIAVLLFTVLFSRRKGLAAVPAFVFGGLALGILSGGFDALLLRPEALGLHAGHEHATFLAGGRIAPQGGLGITGIVRAIAPGLAPVPAARLVAFFVFAQSVHYVVWLRLVPEDARERPGLRSFRSSFRALEADLGRPLLFGALAVGVGIAIYAFVSLEASRILYLRTAVFHTYLEIAALLLVVLEGRGALFAPRATDRA